MYSILILDGDTATYTYVKDDVGVVWTGTLAEAKIKYISLLKTYTTSMLTVVHNTTVDLSSIEITDVVE